VRQMAGSRGRAVLLVLACLVAHARPVASQGVVLDHGLQAGRHLLVEMLTENVNDMRLKEDRGLAEQARSRGMRFPVVLQTAERQLMRQRTGPAAADGSFAAELTLLEKSTTLRAPDGQEHQLPDARGQKGLRVEAVIEAGGRVREGSLAVSGVDGNAEQAARAVVGQMLQQMAALEPLTLSAGQSVPQSLRMSLPLPGLKPLDLTMHTTYRLLGVEDGVADIETVHRMDFHLPDGVMKMRAEGAGGGRMRVDVDTRILRLTESSWVMELEIDVPDGLIAMAISSRFTQHTRDAD
jgi:hypothetical protein